MTGNSTAFTCHNPPQSTDKPETSVGQQMATMFIAYGMLGLCLCGLYGNLVCALIFSRPSMRSSINVLLTGLSGLDSVILLLSIPSFIVPALNELKPVTYWSCVYPMVIRFVYPLTMAAQTASVWTFVVISIERYIAVCRPFDVLNTMSRRKAAIAQILVILASLLYNAVRFWEFQTQDESPWYKPLLRADPYYFSIYYTGFYLAFNFLIPFATISILNVQIANSVRHVGSRHKDTVIRSTTSRRQSEYRTTRMIFVVTFMFAVCNTPAFLINIWESVDRITFSNGHFIAFLLSDVATCLVLINSATTMLVYLIFCRRFRRFFCIYHLCGYRTYKMDNNGTGALIINRRKANALRNMSALSNEYLARSSLINVEGNTPLSRSNKMSSSPKQPASCNALSV